MDNMVDEEYVKARLKLVGKVLIYVGIIDIAFMIMCAVADISYVSSTNILAAILGMFIYRGSLKAARLAAMFMGFIIVADPLIVLILFYDFPLTLFRLYLIHPQTDYLVVFWIVLTGSYIVSIWAYKVLTCDKIIVAAKQAGLIKRFWGKPSTGMIYALVLVLLLSPLAIMKSNSEFQNRAIMEAKLKVGGNYKYYVQSVTVSKINLFHRAVSKTYVSAQVVAYNDFVFQNVNVRWQL